MKIIRRFLSDIRRGENLDLYFFVVAALTLAILNGLGLASQTLIESVTLALLGLLAAYSLGIRERLADMQAKLTGANTILRDKLSPTIKESLISEAREILIIGISLNRTIITYYSHLEEKLKNNQKVKVLLVEPNTETTQLMNQRSYRPLSEKRLSTKILGTLELLCSLQAIAPELVEIRTINFPLPFGCMVSNIDANDSSIALDYYSYKTAQSLPCMVLSKRAEPYWHSIYKTQILNLWTASTPWTCQPKKQL